jgi:hypothetical protein
MEEIGFLGYAFEGDSSFSISLSLSFSFTMIYCPDTGLKAVQTADYGLKPLEP